MLLLVILKIVVYSWLLLLIIQSLSNDITSLVVISGMIIASLPFGLMLAWLAGYVVFRAVFLFSLFVIVIITLHSMQLGFR